MEPTDYESLLLEDKPITIRQYATYVLSHPEIKQTLHKIKTYQQTADRLIDSLHGMIDTEMLPIIIYSEDERVALECLIKDMEAVKRVGLTRITEPIQPKFIIKSLGPERGLPPSTCSSICTFIQERSGTTLANVSLSLFKHFTLTPVFSDYFITGEIPRISPATCMMEAEEELLAVFSLFLWEVMHYKCEESFNFSGKRAGDPYMSVHRPSFLAQYKEQIRLDGTGSIRLLFDDPLWGKITIEGHMTQDPLSLTGETLAIIRANPRTSSSLACDYCGARLTTTWLSESDERILFCNCECRDMFMNTYIK